MSFKVTFGGTQRFSAAFSAPQRMAARFTPHIDVPIVNYYEGAYSFTPTGDEQTIYIQGLTGKRNITIAPIPDNYGLITWNGSTLTVS